MPKISIHDKLKAIICSIYFKFLYNCYVNKFLILLAFLPFLSVSQSFECTTVIPNNSYADTIFYCVSNASCHDLCDGSITINVVGDNQPYSFSWSNGASFTAGDNFRDSLCANQYIISIIDVNGNLVNNTHVNDLMSPPNFTLFTDLLQDPAVPTRITF